MRRIGRYSLVEPLAAGATSEVFLAKLDDQTLATSPELPRAHGRCERARRGEALSSPRGAGRGVRRAVHARDRGRNPLSAPRMCRRAGRGHRGRDDVRGARARPRPHARRRPQSRARRPAPNPREIALWIAAECASALRAAHLTPWVSGSSERMVHGGLCPSSVLLSEDGRVKLLGMGLGRSRTRVSSTSSASRIARPRSSSTR